MADKPVTQEGYGEEVSGRVRAVCLDLATRLGDLLNDIVVVGGLVPSLLVGPGKSSTWSGPARGYNGFGHRARPGHTG